MDGARWDFIMMRAAKARAEASRCVAALLTQWERKVVCEIDAACWRVCVRRHHLHDQICMSHVWVSFNVLAGLFFLGLIVLQQQPEKDGLSVTHMVSPE